MPYRIHGRTYLTLAEICQLLGVHRTTLRRRVLRGDPTPRVTVWQGTHLYDAAEVDEWLARRRNGGAR